MNDITAWLTGVLDEIERVARLADTQHRWRAVRGEYGPEVHVGAPDHDGWSREVNHATWVCDDEQDGCPESARAWMAEAKHIALHDPAAALADVAAKRKILDLVRGIATARDASLDASWVALGEILRAMAIGYAAWPGFQDRWRLA